MNRNKFLEGHKTKRQPGAEVGQLWRWKDAKVADHNHLMLLHRPYDAGFHCIMAEGRGNISFNGLQDFYENYQYVGDATPEIIKQIEDDHEKFKKNEPVARRPILLGNAEIVQELLTFAHSLDQRGLLDPLRPQDINDSPFVKRIDQ